MPNDFDCYLNGTGYMLAKDPQGRLLSSASKEQRASPFIHHVTTEDRWKLQSFKFENGAGASKVDGSGRYRRGTSIDTRGGNLILGPPLVDLQGYGSFARRVHANDPITDKRIDNTTARGFAVKTVQQAGCTAIQAASVLVKRDNAINYWAAAAFTVEIYSDVAGAPGVSLGNAPCRLQWEPHRRLWSFVGDPWPAGEYFWLTVQFEPAIAMAALTPFWLVVMNNQNYPLYWGRETGTAGWTTAGWDGAAWTVVANSDPPYHTVRGQEKIDSPATDFADFRGADNIKRLYAAVGSKVMCLDPANGWVNSYTAMGGREITDLCVFNNTLFACRGVGYELATSTGASATTVWAIMAANVQHQGQCLAVHDNLLWKANGAGVRASATGATGAWAAAEVTVGDPGKLIQAMVSHGGKLFCAKPEGIFEINYPDTYPASGTPSANMVLDFSTDEAPRPWLLDWHSGLYFPSTSGLYAWQGGVLRDLWASDLEEASVEAGRSLDTTTQAELGAFYAVCGTTRGLFAAMMSKHLHRLSIWYYRAQQWHIVFNDPFFVGEYCRAMYYQSLGAGKGRLWFGYGSNICYLDMPSWTDDRSMDSRCSYIGGLGSPLSECELPAFDDGKPHETKDWHRVGVTSKNMGALAGGTVGVYFQVDKPKNHATWEFLGTITTSPYEELPFTLPLTSSGKSIRLKLVLSPPFPVTGYTMEIEEVVLKFHPMPDPVITYQVTVLAADDIPKRNNVRDTRTGAQIWTALKALDALVEPFTYIDELGVSHTVKALGISKVGAREVQKPSPQEVAIEAQVMVTMIEV